MLGKPRQSWILDFGSHAVDSNPGILFWFFASGTGIQNFKWKNFSDSGIRIPLHVAKPPLTPPPPSPAPSHQVKTDHYPFLGNCPPTPVP